MNLSHGPRHISTVRSSNGCWSCRLRRKKCDETYPLCDVCASLHITCHYDQDKPEWMDGGVRQEEMAERLRREVRENAHLRRGERAIHVSGDRFSIAEAPTSELVILPETLSRDLGTPIWDSMKTVPEIQNDMTGRPSEASTVWLPRGSDCTLNSNDAREGIAFGRSDTVLLMFYLEQLLPFLFPFYRPSLLEGGRSWILEMMISSPVVRHATLCQSSYFFSLARGVANSDAVWETLLKQTKAAFGMLGQALQVISGSGINEHMHGAVRIMASIMQVQRFEIAVLSFNNCPAHLNAALTLFKQLLDSPGAIEPAEPLSRFNAVICRLGPSSWIWPTQNVQVPSAEQAAFRFSSAVLILDDVIASTVLQEQPRLYEYHRSLLGNIDGTEPSINLETVVGCQNWALLLIGEIAVLDAWKQGCRSAETSMSWSLSIAPQRSRTHWKLVLHNSRLIPWSLQKILAAFWMPLHQLTARN